LPQKIQVATGLPALKEAVLLADVADIASILHPGRVDRGAVDLGAAFVGHDQASHAVEGRRLAGAVGPHEGEHGAGLQDEI